MCSFFLFLFFGLLIFFGEDCLGRIVYAGAELIIILVWKVPWIAFISYSLCFVWSMLFISIKCFLTVSLIVGNFIDIYIIGIIAVLISFILYFIYVGLLFFSLFLFIFLSSLFMFLFILGLLELFSTFFQSLTLSNRLSINMLCGSLLTSLLSSFIYAQLSFYINCSISWLSIMLYSIFLFEVFNSIVQCAIFNVLSFEYLKI